MRVYCEITGDVGVRIRNEGRGSSGLYVPVVGFWGRASLITRVGEIVNPAAFPVSSLNSVQIRCFQRLNWVFPVGHTYSKPELSSQLMGT